MEFNSDDETLPIEELLCMEDVNKELDVSCWSGLVPLSAQFITHSVKIHARFWRVLRWEKLENFTFSFI
jgi:hypothetical protein